MTLKPLVLLKNVLKWVFKGWEGIADAEERIYFGKVLRNNEGNKK